MQSNDYFVRLPVSVLMDPELSRSAILIYAVLLDLADQYGIIMNETIDSLADRCHCSPRTVRRSERQLVDKGMISIDRTGRASLICVKGMQQMLRQVSGVREYVRAKRKEA